MKRRIICFWASFLAGLALFCGAGWPERPGLAAVFLLPSGVFLAALLLGGKKRRGTAGALLFGVTLALLLSLLFEGLLYRPALALAGENSSVTGVVTGESRETDYVCYTVRLERVRGVRVPYGSALLYTQPDVLARLGDRVTAVGDVRPLGDSAGYYKARGVYLKLSARPGSISLSAPAERPIGYRLQRLRERLSQRLYDSTDGDAYQLSKALLLGDRSTLPDSLTRLFAAAGMSHALAVSGMHISFLALLLSWILSRLRVNYRLANLLTALFALGYVVLIGAPFSALRAGLMAAIFFGGKALYRDADSLIALFTAVGAICLLNPYAVLDVGLELSFLSVLGLLLLYPRWMGLLPARIWRPFRRVLSGALATVSAVLMTLPVTAYVFGELPLISPIANLLLLPAVFCVMALALLLLLVGWVPPLGAAVGALIQLCCTYLKWGLAGLTALPGARLYLPSWTALPALCLVLSVFAALWAQRRGKRIAGAVALVLCVLLPVGTFLIWRAESTRPQAAFLDVGQGECIVLSDGGDPAVVDCGSSSSRRAGETAAGYLHRQGISRISVLVVTHGHEDHANGVSYLLDSFPVGRLVLPAGDNTALLTEIKGRAGELGIPILYLRDRDTLPFGETGLLEFYRNPEAEGENDRAIGAAAQLAGRRILLPSDFSAGQESWLLGAADCRADILKAAHHGSAASNSEAFLEGVRAEWIVICSGENSFSLPAPETVERMENFCDNILMTRDLGTIVFRLDGAAVRKTG